MSRFEPKEPENFDTLSYAVCGYCRNRSSEACIKKCVPEGLYRYFEPVPLEEWDNPPALPPMRELLEHRPATRLALVYMALHYLREEAIRSKPPLYNG